MSNKTDIYRELKGCKEGKPNITTKEHYCNLYMEFCKFIKCNKKSNNDFIETR